MADDLLRRWQLLDSQEERLDAIRRIMALLNHAESAAARDALSSQTDPMANLPLEIILQTLGHLNFLDVWTLQSVCRRWRSVLSSERVLRNAIARWETHDLADAAADETGERRPSAAPLARRVRNSYATRFGRPFSVRVFGDDQMHIQDNSLVLKGNRLAYSFSHEGEPHRVAVHDLTSTQTWHFKTEGREAIQHVILTSDLLAFITFTGHLYYAHLPKSSHKLQQQHQPTQKSMRLPSSQVRAASGDGKLIVLALGGSSHPEDSRTEFVVLDFAHDRRTTFTFDPRDHTASPGAVFGTTLLIPNARTEHVDVFCMASPEEHPDYLLHARLTLAGAAISTKAFSLPEAGLRAGQRNFGRDAATRVAQPSGHRDVHLIKVYYGTHRSQTPVHRLHFDARACTLDNVDTRVRHSPKNPCLSTLEPAAVFWKNIVREPSGPCGYLNLLEGDDGRSRGPRQHDGAFERVDPVKSCVYIKSKIHRSPSHPTSPPSAPPAAAGKFRIVAWNESFMVSLSEGRRGGAAKSIHVACFDEAAQVPGASVPTGLWEEPAGKAMAFEELDVADHGDDGLKNYLLPYSTRRRCVDDESEFEDEG